MNMKYFLLFAALVYLSACSFNKPDTNGLKLKVEQQTGMKLKYGEKDATAQVIYYTLTDADIANNRGNFDSIRSAVRNYFNGDAGKRVEMADKVIYEWEKDGFYVVMMSGITKDSSIIINLTTSSKPILTGEGSPH